MRESCLKKLVMVKWRDSKQYKSLILEHHMAASRFGFLELYLPLNEVPVFNTSLRDGSISELLFCQKLYLRLFSL